MGSFCINLEGLSNLRPSLDTELHLKDQESNLHFIFTFKKMEMETENIF